MSILGRLSNLIRSNLNAAVDKLGDPAKEIDLLITEMEEEMKRVRIELRDQLAREKLLQKKVDEEYRGVQKWQEHAERAVHAGDDELAKEALRRRDEAEKKLEGAEGNHAEQSRLVAKLTEQLKAGDLKLTEIKGRRETLKARARAAKQSTATGGEGTAFDRFNSLVSEIEEKEHQAEAMAALDPELGAAAQVNRDIETQQRFDRLLGPGGGAGSSQGSAKNGDLDARLAALKAKLDKGPADA
jgi:phage shock protein A